jgi:Ran GTPase-activating protein (RanGAP) involved in mRNA processing and transport
LTNLHESLEELSFTRESRTGRPEEYYTQTAAALIDVLRHCSRLYKVYLTGDALRSVNPEELLPYGHLFHELEFENKGQTMASVQGISKLFVNCGNLRKLRYQRSDDEPNSLFLPAVHQSCPLLEELELYRFSFNQQEQTADRDAGMFTLVHRNCRRLHTLVLYHCTLSASVISSIAGMEVLKDLTVRECRVLTVASMALLTTMRLERLYIYITNRSAAYLQSFVGSNLSQTLETFNLLGVGNDGMLPIDDVKVATALASCQNLKKLRVNFRFDRCMFGRNGLDGLQAMATGCPLLADVSLALTAPGLHYIATHCSNLKHCVVLNRRVAGAPTPEGFPSIAELQTLYPAVTWKYG